MNAASLFVPAWLPADAGPAADPPPAGATLILHHPRAGGIASELSATLGRRAVTTAPLGPGAPHPVALSALERVIVLGDPELTAAAEQTEAASLTVGEEHGVLPLFAFVRAVLAAPPTARRVSWWVCTWECCPRPPGRPPTPWSAAMSGLMRVVAREQPAWEVRCVDLETGMGAPAVAALLHEPGLPPGEEIVWSDGRPHLRHLEPWTPLRTAVAPPGEGTHVVIAGGGQGVGAAVACHLAATRRARLTLLGRSRPGPAQARLLGEVRAAGGDGIYVACDILDRDALEHAVADGVTRFGAVRGLVHSALVLADSSVARMPEASFRAVLAVKTTGAVNLLAAVDPTALAWVSFFSSLSRLIAIPGQGNYVAGCAFQASYAAYLGRRLGLHVGVIDWGRWLEIGRGASAAVGARLARAGILGFSPAAGLAAFEDSLAGALEQLVAVHAVPELLERLRARNQPATTARSA